MKWALLLFLVACGAKNSVTPPQGTARQPGGLLQPKTCSPDALPAAHIRNEDYLAFPNFGFRGIGRCRGHALLTQKLTLLMRFNPQDTTPLDCDTDPVVCRQKIRSLLDQVEKNNPVVVPGFASLAEFSAQPVIRGVLKGRIISYGHKYMANRIPLPGDETRSILVYREAMRRVLLHQMPYLGIEGSLVGDHGVLAYATEFKDQKRVLCIRDPNIVPKQGREECDNYMYVDEGRVRYVRFERPEDSVLLNITDDEDRRVRGYRSTLCANSGSDKVESPLSDVSQAELVPEDLSFLE